MTVELLRYIFCYIDHTTQCARSNINNVKSSASPWESPCSECYILFESINTVPRQTCFLDIVQIDIIIHSDRVLRLYVLGSGVEGEL